MNLRNTLQAAVLTLSLATCSRDTQPEATRTNNTANLVDAALNSPDSPNEATLMERFRTTTDSETRIAYLHQIYDQAFLKEVATDTSLPTEARAAALFNITDQAFLEEIVRNEGNDPYMRCAALAQMTDREVLEEFANLPESPDPREESNLKELRQTAARRLAQLFGR